MAASWTEFDKRRQSSTHRCLVPGGPHPDLKQASFIPSARGLCPCYSLPLLWDMGSKSHPEVGRKVGNKTKVLSRLNSLLSLLLSHPISLFSLVARELWTSLSVTTFPFHFLNHAHFIGWPSFPITFFAWGQVRKNENLEVGGFFPPV